VSDDWDARAAFRLRLALDREPFGEHADDIRIVTDQVYALRKIVHEDSEMRKEDNAVIARLRAELTRLIADRDEALAIADRHRLTCQGVEEDFHALEENNERLRGALAVCVDALDDLIVEARPFPHLQSETPIMRKARTARDTGIAALTKET
jgi:hypothetical protein